MDWRYLQQHCSLELYLALLGACELAQRANSPWVGVDHLLYTMLADQRTRPPKNLDKQELNLHVLFARLTTDECQRRSSHAPKGGDEVQILEPGPNGNSSDNWNEDVNADGPDEDKSGWIHKR